MESRYDKRGVSAQKTDVHEAIKGLDKGLFPNAFCKILPDYVANDPEFCNVMHADTAGTKTSLAYMYWKETGDLSVWENIVQDAMVMNLDDMAAVGLIDNIVISSTIGRNKNLITGDVIKTLIQGAQKFADQMAENGIQLHMAGGETADVGDIVRTIDVGFTTFGRLPRKELIINDIKAGQVIVGLSSYGQSSYESAYNSGIGSNGLTSARHDTLNKAMAEKYPDAFDPNTDSSVVFIGDRTLTDKDESGHEIGKLLLSPTRTYLPVLKKLFSEVNKNHIHGIIHCTGGAQTKVLHFTEEVNIIKNKLFEIPPVFKMIQKSSGADWKEMYEVFNMGHRLEFYVDEDIAASIIDVAKSYNIEAQVIGYVENSDGNTVSLSHDSEVFTYSS